ncbi:MAG: DNA methyltransferase [Chitinophagaceae bacterium]
MTLQPNEVFELMHQELDKVWKECFRVLTEGGFLCINIGDATRTINGNFKLYNNHSRIAQYCNSIGFNEMPCILWRKETNALNKFMGSGMLPCGAYVTLEHEYILIFRKGSKRDYRKEVDKNARKNSAFFWEERNAFEARVTAKKALIPDHKFSEVRWDEETKAENSMDMTDAEIIQKFQLLDNQRNQQKREICRRCFQEGIRGTIYGIKYFYEGDENWDPNIPKVGKAAEKGCIGCPWYDIELWRKMINKHI